MKTGEISRITVKRIVFTVSVVALCVAQNSFLPALGLTVPFFPVIPLTVAIAMFEHEFTGMWFGLFAGILWDIASPVTDGVITLFFTVTMCAAGLLTHYLLRCTLLSAMVITAAQTAAYLLLCFLFNCLSRSADVPVSYLLTFCLPAMILDLICTVPIYYFIKSIEKRSVK